MREALAEQVTDAELRAWLDRKLADLADFMRNRAEAGQKSPIMPSGN